MWYLKVYLWLQMCVGWHFEETPQFRYGSHVRSPQSWLLKLKTTRVLFKTACIGAESPGTPEMITSQSLLSLQRSSNVRSLMAQQALSQPSWAWWTRTWTCWTTTAGRGFPGRGGSSQQKQPSQAEEVEIEKQSGMQHEGSVCCNITSDKAANSTKNKEMEFKLPSEQRTVSRSPEQQWSPPGQGQKIDRPVEDWSNYGITWNIAKIAKLTTVPALSPALYVTCKNTVHI